MSKLGRAYLALDCTRGPLVSWPDLLVQFKPQRKQQARTRGSPRLTQASRVDGRDPVVSTRDCILSEGLTGLKVSMQSQGGALERPDCSAHIRLERDFQPFFL